MKYVALCIDGIFGLSISVVAIKDTLEEVKTICETYDDNIVWTGYRGKIEGRGIPFYEIKEYREDFE